MCLAQLFKSNWHPSGPDLCNLNECERLEDRPSLTGLLLYYFPIAIRLTVSRRRTVNAAKYAYARPGYPFYRLRICSLSLRAFLSKVIDLLGKRKKLEIIRWKAACC